MTEFGKHLEVASRPAAQIEYGERRITLDVLQQRLDVLADVVITRAFPEIFGTLVIMFQREVGDFFQVLRIQFHVRSSQTDCAANAHGANSALVEAHPDASSALSDPPGRSVIAIEFPIAFMTDSSFVSAAFTNNFRP